MHRTASNRFAGSHKGLPEYMASEQPWKTQVNRNPFKKKLLFFMDIQRINQLFKGTHQYLRLRVNTNGL
jgi:hypothetical protein